MNLTPYVDSLRREFLLAAEATGEENLLVAERLAPSLDASARLTLLNALSTAADEISRDLAPGAVDVRLRGLEPNFVVTAAAPGFGAENFPAAGPSAANGTVIPAAEEEGTPARINFRLPEHLKARIEEAAGREGLSVNAWLVRAITANLNGVGRSEWRVPPGDQYNVGWVR
ncbi:toxin-antitoxin system HicB family antitoxin [Streptomyces sp. NPDC055239]